MTDRNMLRTGLGGAVVAALCCFTPILAVALGAAGLSAWLGWIDYVLFPVMFLSMGIVAYALYLRAGAPGPSPRAAILVAAVAFSALLMALEFRYALRLSLLAAVLVAGYALYLRRASRRAAGPATPKEQT